MYFPLILECIYEKQGEQEQGERSQVAMLLAFTRSENTENNSNNNECL